MSDQQPPHGPPGRPGPPPPTGMGAGKIVATVAAVVGGLVVLAVVAVVAIAALAGSTAVDDLAKGDCVTAEGLSDTESDEVTEIEVVGCGEPHDGEVLATKELSKSDAEEFNASTAGSDHCAELVQTAMPKGVRGTALTQEAEPASGDLLVCIVYSDNGDELTEKVG